jgi:phosphoribosylformylglycinamidine synthase
MDQQTLQQHGLSPEEYKKILGILGRTPSLTELGIFSVMWSEHCSYKSSRVHLRTLPTTGPRVVQGPGENAGAVDVGDGLVAVFKIESHNHPSFIEPYQGAATGVGGIIRDIFTMGARPIALLNSLRFGSLNDRRTCALLEGVVAGIGGYGNSIGIPTVGGEIAFEDCYSGNPLVNVFCLGVAEAGSLMLGSAHGAGNAVYYVGAKTGRDGIHGATMASAEFDEHSAEKRPAVQVGDPFMEKLLLEACLEVMKTGALVGIQDMGAAGLTCSTAEMGARGGTGIEIDVSQVPQRESGMTPYEIMLSESQERMLMVVKQGRESEVEQVFDKWDLHAVHIGQVTDDGLLRVKDRETVVAEISNAKLADDAPLYDRLQVEPEYLADVQDLDIDRLGELPSVSTALRTLLTAPSIASKRWVYRQYDQMVRTNTITPVGMGAGVVRLKGTDRALALSVDGNGRHCYLDPYRGAMLAVAEAARNVSCAGATPVGATNCLNFGNPERSDIMWQFAQAVAGIKDACLALEIPITGGNVSFYNETDGESIYPTPVLGVVGVLENDQRVLGRVFLKTDAVLIELGAQRGALGGSEYLKTILGLVRGRPSELDLVLERALQQLVPELALSGLVESAHDCSDGGLAVTVSECCFDSGGIGADLLIPGLQMAAKPEVDLALTLFGESASRVILSVDKANVDEVLACAKTANVPARVIGSTGGSRLRISVSGTRVIDIEIGELETMWAEALAHNFVDRVA